MRPCNQILREKQTLKPSKNEMFSFHCPNKDERKDRLQAYVLLPEVLRIAGSSGIQRPISAADLGIDQVNCVYGQKIVQSVSEMSPTSAFDHRGLFSPFLAMR